MNSRILFVSRNYPPQIGGLEVYSYNLIREFEEHDLALKIVLRKSRRHLTWFMPFAFLSALYLCWRHGIRRIHFCDALVSTMGVLLAPLTGARTSATIHGLDITYPHPIYQTVVPRCVARLDKVICVSRSTEKECIRRGVSGIRCRVIPNGIRSEEFSLPMSKVHCRSQLSAHLRKSLQNRILLLSMGRLVTRKGVAWFAEHVFPRLDSLYFYLIAGDGPEYLLVKEVLDRCKLTDRVMMLGMVSNELRKLLLNSADIFVMPNIVVEDDVEGFGIVALEAGACGVPVIAANIQGLRDAVMEGVTGHLVEEKDVEGFLERIRNVNLKNEEIRAAVDATFSWDQVYRRYRHVLIGEAG